MQKIDYIKDWDSWRSDFHFFTTTKVRFSEVDPFNHLNNTVPFVYFEDARIQFFKELGFMQQWSQPGSQTIPVVADLQCNYLKQIYFDEKLNVYIKIARIGTTSIDLHYMAINTKEEEVLVGRGRIVQVGKKSGKPEAWSETMLDALHKMKK
ncbi:thioesterase family protein [Alkalihalobacillus sp. AL-G]|uniref:acyl-CoA thioesterase n=1 Tax=Alkalihalobacillus sp. AL-G TaxID=2926399 RepID=UPI00272C2D5F|nr:thioesterase family protein [Alkalihalobacillus sp. AL-G]WLD92285.1 acyl-CoA thioesterase [Alkalihalobacillus sp. AL-G]